MSILSEDYEPMSKVTMYILQLMADPNNYQLHEEFKEYVRGNYKKLGPKQKAQTNFAYIRLYKKFTDLVIQSQRIPGPPPGYIGSHVPQIIPHTVWKKDGSSEFILLRTPNKSSSWLVSNGRMDQEFGFELFIIPQELFDEISSYATDKIEK